MNRRVVGTAGIPAGVLRADCHAGKDAGGPRFMGSRAGCFGAMKARANRGASKEGPILGYFSRQVMRAFSRS